MPIKLNIKTTPKTVEEVTKAATAEVQKPTLEQDQLQDLNFKERIDELGSMQKKLDQAKAFIKEYNDRLSALTAEIEEAHADVGPDDEYEVHGDHHKLTFGKQSQTRTVKDKEKIIAMMGEKLFLECATISLKDIDNYLTAPQRDEVLEYGHGARSKKLVAKAIK